MSCSRRSCGVSASNILCIPDTCIAARSSCCHGAYCCASVVPARLIRNLTEALVICLSNRNNDPVVCLLSSQQKKRLFHFIFLVFGKFDVFCPARNRYENLFMLNWPMFEKITEKVVNTHAEAPGLSDYQTKGLRYLNHCERHD